MCLCGCVLQTHRRKMTANMDTVYFIGPFCSCCICFKSRWLTRWNVSSVGSVSCIRQVKSPRKAFVKGGRCLGLEPFIYHIQVDQSDSVSDT